MVDKYGNELRNFSETYAWSLNLPIDRLCTFIESSLNYPLLSVGSGGSLTAAYMTALLHQEVGGFAKAVSPLALTSTKRLIPNSNIFILSAGGHNNDILSAFRISAELNAQRLLALCMSSGSSLAALTNKYQFAQVLEFDIPAGKDGFLATNSLLAFMTILTRGYFQSFPILQDNLPGNLQELEDALPQLTTRIQPLYRRNTWIVLYGGWGLPAAIDLESKFTEAALKNIQPSDYRNFGHGRHHWLAKKPHEAGVVALVTPDEKDVADKTLQLLPSSVPVLKIETKKDGPTGSIELLFFVLHLVHCVGKSLGIDPGSPGVPEFGRRIYHLRTSSYKIKSQLPKGMTRVEEMAILKKSQRINLNEFNLDDLKYWRVAYRNFTRKINKASFGSIVFDYDGTICDPSHRYDNLAPEIAEELLRLLKAGIYIGVATGRGKSVRIAFQNSIPKDFWDLIYIGYYNGADIAPLYDFTHPRTNQGIDPTLDLVRLSLENYEQLKQMSNIEYRPKQISVEPKHFGDWKIVRSILFDAVQKVSGKHILVLESSHSLDVIAPNVSKQKVVTTCETIAYEMGGCGLALCIGDSGQWPGNDYQFLSSPYSISVDTTSPDPSSCWNLNPLGLRGMQATLAHLKRISIKGNTFHIKF